MSANYSVNVPKLKGRENYDDWSFAVQNYLVLEGLSKYIEQEPEASAIGDDAKAKAKLILTLDSTLYVHVRDANSTKSVWDKLKSLFDNSGFTRKIGLLRGLISTRLENCDSMVDYVNRVVDAGQKLRNTGFKIDDEWIGSLLLAGLPEKYAPMIMAIEHSGIQITTDAIKSKLLDMAEDGSKSSGSAFKSAQRYKNGNAGSSSINRNGSSGNAGPSSTIRNSSGNSGILNRAVNVNSAVNVRCYKCKQIGHYRNKCPMLNNNSQMSGNAFSAVFLNGSFSKRDWYVDSGASVHLTANTEWLENRTDEITLREIVVANKDKVQVQCAGNINITTAVGKRCYDIKVKNVFCVPELTTNLLSVSQMIKNGNKVDFNDGSCKIYNKQGQLVAVANLTEGVYKLNIKDAETCLITKLVTGETWHRRFGHLNGNDLNKMKNAVIGLSFNGAVKAEKQNCIVCCEGKQSRLPFPQKGSRASSVLEIIHADVCGPMEVSSIGGSKYFLVFEDDYSRMAFVYFLKTKDEVFQSFKDFKKMVEVQKDSRIRILRTDNGGEFCSKLFEDFLKASGIIHQRTNPYTPEQNGTAERLNRILVERAKCLLFDAKLEKQFWAEGINTAVYLRNRSISSALQSITPYEMWTGNKPNVSHLRIFGSTAMVHTPKEKRLKWDKKATKHILVGYSDYIKGYRVYNPVKNSVTTSRDVVIFEDTQVNMPVADDRVVEDIPEEPEDLDSVGDKEELENRILEDQDDSSYVPDEEIEEEKHVNIRRSTRVKKPKALKDYVTYMCAETKDIDRDPITVDEAMSRPDHKKWKEAMQEELQSFEENEAWELVDSVPQDKTTVQCKWVFKKKCDSEDNIKYRARLVAKGFTQQPGVDYEETFSPVVRHSTLRLLFALAVKLDLNVNHLDVKTAFLNGHLNEQIFMLQPEGFVKLGDEHKVLKLKKAIYGLKQASRAWYQKVDELLNKLNYNKSKYEPCIFTKKTENGLLTIVALYVDDFLLFSNDPNETKFLKSQLSSNFKIKDLGQARNCLGMRIVINKNEGTITLDQEKYVEQLLDKFKLKDCKPMCTPIEANLNMCKSENVCNIKYPYQQLIGCLMYLSVMTRPDISFSVSYLSQFNNCYNDTCWKYAKRILQYLKATKMYGLKFTKDDAEIEGFVDADWASNSLDRKSYTGFCFKLSTAAISWESVKQKTVALSSTEAEYMAISEAAKEAIYLRNVLHELTFNVNCVVLFNDNQSAQKLSNNPMYHKRSKHIDVRHHFIRECIAKNYINVKYLCTNDMTADILTKGLCKVKHWRFVENLGLVKCTR